MKKMSQESTEKDAEVAHQKKLPYPKSIIFIIGNEFCERFSYYGMRTILVLYFKIILNFTEDSATQAFHIFAMACYFTPVLGAIIADSFLGKFMTIFIISCIYAVGNIILSIASYSATIWMSFLGLGLIALGTGGIKPCVSAFGGDQFLPGQEKQLQSFFSLFYVSINAGSLISTFLTPILRQDVKCYGRSDCYPLAFGVPAILMLIAVVLFIAGKYLTKYRIIPPQKDNVVVTVSSCVCHAIGRRFSSKSGKKNHWLEYADDKYNAKTINDVKILMQILFLYFPLPIFWALFDQQASRWTLQAIRMNGQLGSFIIKPDQIQVINPLLVISFIPIFDYIIYPVLNKFRINRPLQRMTIGGILAACSFIVCALFQLKIEAEQPGSLLPGHNHLVFSNGLNCTLNVTSANFSAQIPPYDSIYFANVERNKVSTLSADFHSSCADGSFHVDKSVDVSDGQSLVVYISEADFGKDVELLLFSNVLTKPAESGAQLFILFDLESYKNETFSITETNVDINDNVQIVKSLNNRIIGYLKPFEVEVKGKDVILSIGDSQQFYMSLSQGATYIQMIIGDMKKPLTFTEPTMVVAENKLSVFLQLIQYFIMTSAEIMFSVTGLEFSYSQAPKSMKSVVQAAWLLTVAFGNLIVAIIADLKIFDQQSKEFFFFAGLMLLDILIFAIMAYYYVPSKFSEDDEDESDMQMKQLDEKQSQD